MGMNTPQGTSMDYKNFIPTYSHRHIPTDKMDMDGDEYWTPKVLQTHLKIKKLYGVIYEYAIRNIEFHTLLYKVNDLKSKVGIWTTERVLTLYRRRNLITNSEWETIHDPFPDVPYGVWLEEGVVIILPSTETIEWLNELAHLYCVSNKETV